MQEIFGYYRGGLRRREARGDDELRQSIVNYVRTRFGADATVRFFSDRAPMAALALELHGAQKMLEAARATARQHGVAHVAVCEAVDVPCRPLRIGEALAAWILDGIHWHFIEEPESLQEPSLHVPGLQELGLQELSQERVAGVLEYLDNWWLQVLRERSIEAARASAEKPAGKKKKRRRPRRDP